MKIYVEAKVWYTCTLNEEDEKKVKNYAEENEISLEEAVWDLYGNTEIELYENSVESDFSTESIEEVIE